MKATNADPISILLEFFLATRNFMCYEENYKKHEEMIAFFQYHRKFLEIWSFIRWQCFFGLFFVRVTVSLIYRGQSRKRWWRGREKKDRRQLTMILHMPHSFWFTFFSAVTAR